MVPWDTCTKHLEEGSKDNWGRRMPPLQGCPTQNTDLSSARHADVQAILDGNPGVDILEVVAVVHMAVASLEPLA